MQRSSKKIHQGEVLSGAEHQVRKNSSGRQVASFQHAKYCSSTVSHLSFCILIHLIYVYIFLNTRISPKHSYLQFASENKRKSCIKVFKTWRNLSEFSPRVQLWGPQSPFVSSSTLSGSINQTSYLHCQQGQHNKHKSNLGTEQGSRTKQQTKIYKKVY